jgi:ribonuclease P/MRP protein subunit POP8
MFQEEPNKMSSSISSQHATQDSGKEAIHTTRTQTLASPFSYALLELVTDGPQDIHLDNILVKSYCTAALKQFLGLTGQAIPIDVLKAESKACWLRMPKEDLGSFSAAITAYRGVSEGDTRYILRMKKCSDWLGLLTDEGIEAP